MSDTGEPVSAADGKGGSAAASPRRVPRQRRGARRFDAILDAAAELLVEGTMEGLTMRGIRERSGATTGSLYYFFPDRESVLRALAERHTNALMELVERNVVLSPEDWARMPLGDRVDRLLESLFAYAEAHRDFLSVFRSPPAQQLARFWDLYELGVAVTARLVEGTAPGRAGEEAVERADLIMATIDGVLQAASRSGEPASASLLREYKVMLTAYLAALSAR